MKTREPIKSRQIFQTQTFPRQEFKQLQVHDILHERPDKLYIWVNFHTSRKYEIGGDVTHVFNLDKRHEETDPSASVFIWVSSMLLKSDQKK